MEKQLPPSPPSSDTPGSDASSTDTVVVGTSSVETSSADAPPQWQMPPRNISGWLVIFLIIMCVGGVFSSFQLIDGVLHTDVQSFEDEKGLMYIVCGVDILLAVFLLLLAVYATWSFVKRRPDAVFWGKTYVVYMVAANLFLSVMSIGSDEQFIYGAAAIRSVIWGIIWFTYLSVSKQVKEIFPVSQRRILRFDYYLFGTIVVMTLAAFSILFVELMRHVESGSPQIESITQERLSYNEYSDGFVAFRKPEGWACTREQDEDGTVYFTLNLSDACMATVLSGGEEKMDSETFMQIVDSWTPESDEGTSLEVLGNTVDKTPTQRIYHYSARFYSEGPWLWHFVLVQDLLSPIVCVISYFQIDDAQIVQEDYLSGLIESVRFR